MDPIIARKTWRTLEPIHGMIYFVPEAEAEYAHLGVTMQRTGYFASRAAPMGAVTADVVISTFYNFNPKLVRAAMNGAWDIASPLQFTNVRFRAVDAALRRAWGDEMIGSSDVKTLAILLRRVAEVACEKPEGRPLFAGHSSVAWPEEPHLVLWHAQTLLREFRGDGHIAALTAEGLTGIEALVSHAASGDVPAQALTSSRSWSDDEWSSAIEGMRGRGLVTKSGDLAFTPAGDEQRARIETTTDALATSPYAAFGEEVCEQIRQLGRPLSRAIMQAGLLPLR